MGNSIYICWVTFYKSEEKKLPKLLKSIGCEAGMSCSQSDSAVVGRCSIWLHPANSSQFLLSPGFSCLPFICNFQFVAPPFHGGCISTGLNQVTCIFGEIHVQPCGPPADDAILVLKLKLISFSLTTLWASSWSRCSLKLRLSKTHGWSVSQHIISGSFC